jgi:uncharacterized protein YrrD
MQSGKRNALRPEPTDEEQAMSRHAKELVGLEVVSLDDATRVGVTGGLVVDRPGRRVAGFVIDLGFREAKALDFADVCSVHEGVVMVRSAEAVRPLSTHQRLRELATGGLGLTGLPAINDRGETVGTVADFLVDVAGGAITGLEVETGEPSGARRLVHQEHIVGIGSELVLLDAGSLEPVEKGAR